MKRALILCFCSLLYIRVCSQITLESIIENAGSAQLVRYEEVREFYSVRNFNSAWIGNRSLQLDLIRLLKSAPSLGLRTGDYQNQFLTLVESGKWVPTTAKDSILGELKFTDAAIHFLSDVAYGNSYPALGYKGFEYKNDCRAIIKLLSSAIQSSELARLTSQIEPALPGYRSLKDTLRNYLHADSVGKTASRRREELPKALNWIRWLNCVVTDSAAVIVNIPSATLLVYDHGKIILESKVIVGKRSTPTSTLSSKITEVVLFPYWMVPNKIATQELLPLIRKNIGYLSANGFQVLNRQGKIVDPYKIDWNVLGPSNFPYTLRQSTGCDNSLGLIKLNFYSPFLIYLHDTPWKSLFTFKKRYFSHGCMRVEKTVELARIVLGDKAYMLEKLETEKNDAHPTPVPIPAGRILPVYVIYSTAWIDSSGVVTFSEDIYRKFPLPKSK